MKLTSLVLAAAFMAANPLNLGDTASRARYQEQDARLLHSLARTTEPIPTPVVPGSMAPDFAYESIDNVSHRLRDLLDQGSVLLVFGPRDEDLDTIESEREHLLDLGVIPVAVLDGGNGRVRSAMKRMDLKYTVIPDPVSAIASQFNALDPTTQAAQACWFVLDRTGRVRSLDRTGLPDVGYVSLAAAALAIPRKGVTLPAAR